MSLTRAEWNTMWIAIKVIEQQSEDLYCGNIDQTLDYIRQQRKSISIIKEKIQSVIGQKENESK